MLDWLDVGVEEVAEVAAEARVVVVAREVVTNVGGVVSEVLTRVGEAIVVAGADVAPVEEDVEVVIFGVVVLIVERTVGPGAGSEVAGADPSVDMPVVGVGFAVGKVDSAVRGVGGVVVATGTVVFVVGVCCSEEGASSGWAALYSSRLRSASTRIWYTSSACRSAASFSAGAAALAAS